MFICYKKNQQALIFQPLIFRPDLVELNGKLVVLYSDVVGSVVDKNSVVVKISVVVVVEVVVVVVVVDVVVVVVVAVVLVVLTFCSFNFKSYLGIPSYYNLFL